MIFLKKILFVGFLLLALVFITACHSSNDLNDDKNISLLPPPPPPPPATQTNHQMNLVAQCQFLNASDVATACQTPVTMEKKDTMYGPCTFDFVDDQENSVSFIYYQYPADDNKSRSLNYCLTKGEKVSNSVCGSDGSIYVFGDYYSLSLGNSLGTICSYEQLKTLGRLLEKRVYS